MKLMILDGNSIVNRAFYGVRPLTTRTGLYTNAVFGFLNILNKMLAEESPEALCVAFDLHGPTFRHTRYPEYKATRHGMPEELAQQMPVLKDVLRAMNIPMFACAGWEADDVLGTVGKRCGQAGWDCVVVTGDRDALQLVDGHVTVKLVVSKGGQTTATNYHEAEFFQEYGFAPPQMVDLKGLMGDSSDNIPGVAGVGPKTAKDLLHRFGTLSGVYENLDALRPSLRQKLEAGKEMAFLSYELATIRCDAPIDFAPEDCLRKEPEKKALYDLFMQLEFVKLIDRYGLRQAAFAPEPVEEQPAIAHAQALPPAGTACAVVLGPEHQAAVAWDGGVCTVDKDALPSDMPIICHDAKTGLHQGLSLDNRCFDTALAAYDLDPSLNDYSLTRVATAYLGQSPQTLEEQAVAVFRLGQVLPEKLESAGMGKLYREIELPLCPVLYHMETRGVAIDRETLARFGQMLAQRIEAREQEIYGYANQVFNIQSTRQLGEVLFTQLGLPPVKKTKTGYSTNAEVLEKLADKHPIVPAILDYRMLAKLKSTYADGLLKVIGPDGRIHTTFQNMVTATGRLSSTEPNLQNIPVRTELGAEIRKMFVPRPGWVLVDADYSQIELRVLAHVAGDKLMIQAFREGLDIHTATAAQVFGVAPEEVTPLQRRHAKAVNFGIVYGISEFSLAEDIGVSRFAARDYIQAYLDRYSGVRDYMHRIVEQAQQQGYVTTLYGRRRYIPELSSTNRNIRQAAQRIALNTPIQGSAADIIKLAMIRVEQALEGLQARLILQVHDELIVECPPEEAEQVQAVVTQQMEQVAQLSVPLVAEAKVGNTWFDAK